MIYPNDIIAIVCQGIAANLTTLQTISKYLNQVGVVWYGMAITITGFWFDIVIWFLISTLFSFFVIQSHCIFKQLVVQIYQITLVNKL